MDRPPQYLRTAEVFFFQLKSETLRGPPEAFFGVVRWVRISPVHYRQMLRSGKQRSSANDTPLSDHELRKLEADGVVLEQKLETLRKQQEENARKI